MLHKLRRHWGTIGFLLLLAWFLEAVGLDVLLMLLAAAVIHEAGHLAALKMMGVSGAELKLSPFGAVLKTENVRLSYPGELLVVLAGPGANLLCGAVLTLYAEICPAAAAPAGAHWTLGLFNLLPAVPLDGWRCLQLLLCWAAGPGTGERAASKVGAVAALLLSGGIVLLMAASGGNLWLFPTAAGLVISAWRSLKE